MIKILVFLFSLIFLSIIDIKKQKIPLIVLIGLGVFSVITNLIESELSIANMLMATIPVLILIFFSLILKKSKIGLGDLLLMADIALAFGLDIMSASSVIASAICAIFLLLSKIKKIKIKDTIPFVPFISIAFFIAIILERSNCLFLWKF